MLEAVWLQVGIIDDVFAVFDISSRFICLFNAHTDLRIGELQFRFYIGLRLFEDRFDLFKRRRRIECDESSSWDRVVFFAAL